MAQPHKVIGEKFSEVASQLGNISLDVPEDFKGASANAIRAGTEELLAHTAKLSDAANRLAEINNAADAADQQLAAAPRPKHVQAAQLRAMKIAATQGKSSTAAQAALFEAEQLKAKREAALAEHSAAMTETIA